MNFNEQQKNATQNLKDFLIKNGYGPVEKPFTPFRGKEKGVLLHTEITEFNNFDLQYVFVTTGCVFLYGKKIPYNYTEWFILKERSYSTKEELLKFLNDFIIDKNSLNLWV